MNKLILTQIMKNESHVAHRMLNSIKNIVDGVVVIDTGSTDNSIDIVKQWGNDNNIEVNVFERTFDNFENSRNFSFIKARELYPDTNENIYYSFWLDFDEELIVDDSFDKQRIDKDLYMFSTLLGNNRYTRNELCRLNKPFRWYGPVHEYIICDDRNITSGLMEGISVRVHTDGGSWNTDVAVKYYNQAHVLEKYLYDTNKLDSRWIFYAAQSYHDSAKTNDKDENNERLRRALNYYLERITRKDGYFEEIHFSQYRAGSVMRLLEYPWSKIKDTLLKAYNMDKIRAEPFSEIIDHYMRSENWDLVYLYSKFAYDEFNKKSPINDRVLYVDESLYHWKLAEMYCSACYMTNRINKAKELFKEVKEALLSRPELFTENDIKKIEINSKYLD